MRCLFTLGDTGTGRVMDVIREVGLALYDWEKRYCSQAASAEFETVEVELKRLRSSLARVTKAYELLKITYLVASSTRKKA